MNSDIHLYTASTMNGWKPVLLLEAQIPYEFTHIDFDKNRVSQVQSQWADPNDCR